MSVAFNQVQEQVVSESVEQAKVFIRNSLVMLEKIQNSHHAETDFAIKRKLFEQRDTYIDVIRLMRKTIPANDFKAICAGFNFNPYKMRFEKS